MQNVLSPIDMIGSLVTPRRRGEPLEDYRKRVEQVASQMALRDVSDPQWRWRRETELGGHVGAPLVLTDGSRDPELQETAWKQLFTYERLASWEGPFTWPERLTSGESPLYNRTGPGKGGVASSMDLTPLRDPVQNTYWARSGYALYDGIIYHAGPTPKIVAQNLLPGTTETVLIPYQIVSDHSHRIEVVNDREIDVIGEDHQHRLRLTESGGLEQINFSGSGSHTHLLIPINPTGQVYLTAAPGNPIINSDPDAFDMGVEATLIGSNDQAVGHALTFTGQTVETSESEGHTHRVWVDPTDFWSGRFVIGGEDTEGRFHTHLVDNWEVSPDPEDGHTHEMPVPALPRFRPLLTVITQANEHVFETGADRNPYAAEAHIEQGWTVIRSRFGLGERLLISWQAPDLLTIPTDHESSQDGDILGLGPRLPASRLALLGAIADYTGSFIDIRVRSEDELTGSIAGQAFRLELITEERTLDFESVTSARGEAGVRLDLIGNDKTATLKLELLDKPSNEDGIVIYYAEHTIDLTLRRPLSWGYGIDYGVARPPGVDA